MNNTRRYTPEMMTELSEGEVFVFGSNTKGEHGGGAARIAHTKFDAEWGVGEGITGRCYAIPTLDGNRDKVSREDFISSLAQFICFANEHKNMTFFLTKVGCGIAGWDIDEVRTIFLGKLWAWFSAMQTLHNCHATLSFRKSLTDKLSIYHTKLRKE